MKKRSVLGIIISVIMSIILVPFLWGFGISGTTLMTVSSVIKEERKDEIFNIFLENEGAEWIYGMVEPIIQDMVAEYAGQYEGLDTEGLLTVEDVEKIATEFYAKAVNGEIYQIDVTFIADRIKPQLDGIIDQEIDKQIDQEIDSRIESYVDENLETIYDSLSDDIKAEIKAEAKKIVMEEVEKEFDAQIDELLEEEVDKYIEENYPNASADLVEAETGKYLAENKDQIIADARAETLAEAESTFEEEADTYIRENIRDLYTKIDEETKAELIATAKEEYTPEIKEEYKAQHKQQYVDEYSSMVDEAVLSAQEEINATIASIYSSEEYAELEQTQEEYGINVYDFDGLNEIFRGAGYVCFGAAAVVILLLLLCYLFRPAGFFVAGIVTLILGVGVKAISGRVLPVVNEMVHSAVDLPHDSLGEMINTVLGWMAEGLSESAMIGIFAGAALMLLGILTLIIRRNKTA